MAITKKNRLSAEKRKLRVRGNLKKGTAAAPRISVFRSLNNIYVQMIDDASSTTLVSSSSQALDSIEGVKSDVAFAVGLDLAKKAKERGIEKAFFDRGRYRYLGRVKALADGVREGGIQF